MNNELAQHIFLDAINLVLIILNLLITIKNSIVNCEPMGDLWVLVNPMSTSLVQSQTYDGNMFFNSIYCIRRYEFGQAKFSVFRFVVAITGQGGVPRSGDTPVCKKNSFYKSRFSGNSNSGVIKMVPKTRKLISIY